jgi:hypothetical protein
VGARRDYGGVTWSIGFAFGALRITTQRVQINTGSSPMKDNIELFPHRSLRPAQAARHAPAERSGAAPAVHRPVSREIKGVPDIERLADTLRECSLKERTRRRVTTFVEA